MPSKSVKQKRFMNIAAHSKKFAEQAGIPQSVAKEYHAADTRSAIIELAAARRASKKGKSK